MANVYITNITQNMDISIQGKTLKPGEGDVFSEEVSKRDGIVAFVRKSFLAVAVADDVPPDSMSYKLDVTYESTRIVAQWTSDNTGYCTGIIRQFAGTIGRVTIVPGSGGFMPEIDYRLTIKDVEGIDVLSGIGMLGLSNTMPQSNVPLIDGQRIVGAGRLTVEITDAGDTKKGSVVLHLV